MDKRYKQGKIYKLTSKKTDKIYIGSTIQKLSRRLNKHISDWNQYKKGNTKKGETTSFEILKNGSYKIKLIEDYSCNNRNELLKREGYWIRKLKSNCVNKTDPSRTKKEYMLDNKKKFDDYHKQYRENNRELLREKIRKYRNNNPDKVIETRKRYYQKNKDYIKLRNSIETKCKCGKMLRKCDIPRHNKSNIHKKFEWLQIAVQIHEHQKLQLQKVLYKILL